MSMKSALLAAAVLAAAAPAVAQPTPTAVPQLDYDVEFFPGTSYDPTIPTPEQILGFEPGDRAARPDEIERCLEVWAEASTRTRLVEYARSHEGRALYYMVVTSSEHLGRLDEIQANAGRLADPRSISEEEAQRLVDGQPAVAWMAYSIHGDETSGTDSALAVLYHLIAGTSADVTEILDQVVTLVDPMQNPDGRHRFLQQVAEHRAAAPNVDDQSLLHAGYWPWGRTNHYLFDLNRDWILGVNPESRGRIAAAGGWHPQLMVDAHEMGSQDTYLFSPSRKPRNPHLPAGLDAWAEKFARDQAEAFDRKRWVYYTGEWNEGWYPGYTDVWGAFRGAVGILYEQASFTEDGVRRPGGDIVSYREAVHHQAVSSIANLTTLARNREAIFSDYLADRRRAVAATGPYARRVFAVLPTANRTRRARFVDSMALQRFEVFELTREATVTDVVDQLGRPEARRTLPAGTLLIPNRQPEAHLLATMLEFDGRMPDDYLERERTSILRDGDSTIYDVTSWSTTLLYGLDAVSFEGALPAGAVRHEQDGSAPRGVAPGAVAWIVDGADDASVAFAARLLELGVAVRVAERPVELGESSFERGSVVVLPADNRRFDGDLAAALDVTARELALDAVGVSTGLGEGELPDLGGGHFTRLEAPRIALVARGGLSAYDYGSIWHTLDHQLGIRHSQIDEGAVDSSDLRRYNVVVLPARFSGALPEAARTALGSWIEAGGTLIAIGNSAAELAVEEGGLSAVRRLRDVLDDLDAYESAVIREAMASAASKPPSSAVWSHTLSAGFDTPWDRLGELERSAPALLASEDAWARMFMPQGAFVAARTDGEHWLTFGTSDELPLLVGASDVLMAKQPVETPVRLGVWEERDAAQARRVGWSALPAGHDLRLRMSGLLWPEAAARLANSAGVTREVVGDGQIILFANPPTFRASTHGSARLLLNAIVYGPGFGAAAPIEP